MHRVQGRLRTFWSEDRGLTVVLIVLVLLAFVIGPLGGVGRLGTIALAISTSFLLITGVLTVVQRPHAAVWAGLFAFVTLVFGWLVVWRPSVAMHVAATTLLSVYLALLTAVVCARVFRNGRVTVHRIVGAVAVYILLGVIWSYLYDVIAWLRPAAFRHAEDASLDRQSLLYFSFVTLSTAGYGDIAPAHPVARSLATMEALVGQLYPPILIARLVSLAVASPSEPGAKAR